MEITTTRYHVISQMAQWKNVLIELQQLSNCVYCGTVPKVNTKMFHIFSSIGSFLSFVVFKIVITIASQGSQYGRTMNTCNVKACSFPNICWSVWNWLSWSDSPVAKTALQSACRGPWLLKYLIDAWFDRKMYECMATRYSSCSGKTMHKQSNKLITGSKELSKKECATIVYSSHGR